MKKTVFLIVICVLLLFCASWEKSKELSTNPDMQEMLESREHGTGQFFPFGGENCDNGHVPGVKDVGSGHVEYCQRCLMILKPEEPHILKSAQAGGYAIIDGKLFVVIESRCIKCRAVFDYEYVPYDTSEGTVAR